MCIYFNSGLVPTIWLKSIINPIPKGSKKDPYTPLNYRGISLQSCVYKVYSGLLNSRISAYCEMLNLIEDEQNGFRKTRSCEDHIFSVTSIIQNKLNTKDSVFAAFIDLEKAFDWIDRDLLLYRLLQYNIDGKMYKCIKGLFHHNESCVRINSLCSDWFSVHSGVKQGDNVSPTLFSLYINDLAKEIKHLNKGIQIGNLNVGILLYADDMVLLGNNEADLQCMLDAMYEWCYKWRLKVNIEKSNIVHFRPKNAIKTDYVFKYGATALEMISEYKYLGIILDEHLTFVSCSKTLADSGGRALGAVISKFKQFKDVGYLTFTKLFESCVVPVLDYGSGIWGFVNNTHSELIQNKAMRYFLGVHSFTAIPALQGEMGWKPSKFRKYINILRFWNRLLKMPDERMTKQIFYNDFNLKNNNWCAKVKYILKLIDCEELFNNQTLCDLTECELLLTNIIEKEWKTQINNKPKLRTYKLYKKNYKTSDYVINTLNRFNRSMLAKFRTGILQLRVETGRFTQMKLEDRTCQICNLNLIEDEIHFLCVCNKYDELRKILFISAAEKHVQFSTLSIDLKFIYLMSFCNREVGAFIRKAWEIRKSVLYI